MLPRTRTQKSFLRGFLQSPLLLLFLWCQVPLGPGLPSNLTRWAYGDILEFDVQSVKHECRHNADAPHFQGGSLVEFRIRALVLRLLLGSACPFLPTRWPPFLAANR